MKKDRYESKHQLLTKKYEETGIQHFKDPTAFIKCSSDIKDRYPNIVNYNPNKNCKTLYFIGLLIYLVIKHLKQQLLELIIHVILGLMIYYQTDHYILE